MGSGLVKPVLLPIAKATSEEGHDRVREAVLKQTSKATFSSVLLHCFFGEREGRRSGVCT